MKFRKWTTPAILAFAAISAVFVWGVRPAQAEGDGILSEITPGLLEGFPLESPVTLTADTVSFDEENGVALAEGNVEVGFGTRTIKADRIRYDMKSGEAEFVGQVHYEHEGNEFSFDRIVLNIKTELGAMYNGRIRIISNNYQISSDVMEKTGKRSFFLGKGELTTCPCDPRTRLEIRNRQDQCDARRIRLRPKRDVPHPGRSRSVASVGGISRQA